MAASRRRERLIRLDGVGSNGGNLFSGAPKDWPGAPTDAVPLESMPEFVQEQFTGGGPANPGDFLYSPASDQIYIGPKLWAEQHGETYPDPSTATAGGTSTGNSSATPNTDSGNPVSVSTGNNSGGNIISMPTTTGGGTGAGVTPPATTGGNLPATTGGASQQQPSLLAGLSSGWLWLGLALLLLLLLNDDKKHHERE